MTATRGTECRFGYCNTILTPENTKSGNQRICNDCHGRLDAASGNLEVYRSCKLVDGLLKGAQRRHKDVELVLQDLYDIYPADHCCPILGVPFGNTAKNGHRDYSPSLDRIDSSKGYTKDNVQVISNLANRMKNSATVEQLSTFSRYHAFKDGPQSAHDIVSKQKR